MRPDSNDFEQAEKFVFNNPVVAEWRYKRDVHPTTFLSSKETRYMGIVQPGVARFVTIFHYVENTLTALHPAFIVTYNQQIGTGAFSLFSVNALP
jgi:hypothetical protein